MASWQKDIPNYLTYFRIAVIPMLVAAFLLLHSTAGFYVCATLFFLAGITDWLDGYLARQWNVTSNIGRCLDPIADKLLVATALLLLVGDERAPLLPAIAIL